jgi:two-component system sensor histidine kinase RegB
MSEVATIVRLRWAALAAVIAAIGVAAAALGLALPSAWLAAVLAAFAATNLGLALRGTRAAIGPVLVLDTMLLTVGLALTGGPSNPFSVVFLVYVTLAAVLVPGAFAWGTVALSALGYGLLFFVTPADPHAHHHHMPGMSMSGMEMGASDARFSLHLQGMWVAFTLAAVLIAVFVMRVSRALAAERENAARTARLLGLTTLAAGAAHELATPLSTIKTVAGELDHALESHPELEAMRDDVRLVRREVDRSRAVLERLSLRAGELRGEAAEPVRLADLAAGLGDLPAPLRARVDVECATPDARARVPRRAFEQVVLSLVNNALDASGEAGRVTLAVRTERERLHVEVRDQGAGMSAETLARAGEPFFTTKDPGRGMGLGLFLARTLVDHLGGTLALDSSVGRGTRVVVELPLEARA